MGQQQLLLLVLATVIVGLATVAGIQAFDENQSQATQDVLVQRGTEIAVDLKAQFNKPPELGGGHTGVAKPKNVLAQMGYENGRDDTVPVKGAAGSNPECSLSIADGSPSMPKAYIKCMSSEAPQDVTVTLNGNRNGEITTSFSDN
jgi:hypothetical protein